MSNPTVAQVQPATITPKDAQGNVVDLVTFPTALSSLAWSVDNANAAVVTTNPQGTAANVSVNASYTPGTVVKVSVSAVNTAGETLTEEVDVTFDAVAVPVPVVKSLNIALGTPA